MFAIFNCCEGVDWYSLPSTFRDAPHISVDNDSLKKGLAGQSHYTKPSVDEPNISGSDLPSEIPEKEKNSIKSLAMKARSALKSAQDLTYLCKNKGMLREITSKMTELQEKIKKTIPTDSGLPVRGSPPKRKKVAKKKVT